MLKNPLDRSDALPDGRLQPGAFRGKAAFRLFLLLLDDFLDGFRPALTGCFLGR